MRDLEADTLTVSQQAFAENTATKFGVFSGRTTPLPTDLKLENVDGDEPQGDWLFRELVGCFMWLATKPGRTS